MASLPAMLLNTFIQVNTIRGWRYLDDAGKIINRYDAEFPQKQVGLEGTTLTNPESRVRQVSVNSQRVWIHIEEPDTLTYATDQGWRMVQEICGLLEVTSLSRVGVRLQHAIPVGDLAHAVGGIQRRILTAEVSELLPSLTGESTPDWAFERSSKFALSLPLSHGDLTLDVQLVSARISLRGRKPQDLPQHALVVDVDAYREGEFTLAQARRAIKDAERWASDELPSVVAVLTGEET